MTTCIGFMFQNEEHWLRLHLPVWAKANLPLVALDGGSTDRGADIIRDYNGVVFHRPFDFNFGKQANALFDCCDGERYSSVIWLAPDELMHPHDLVAIAKQLEAGAQAISFPRWNFVKDRYHVSPNQYPDHQLRAWWLREGVRVKGAVHETVYESIRLKGWAIEGSDKHIYHYGGINPLTHLALKHINYQRIEQGLPVLTELPDDVQTGDYIKHVHFTGTQPLSPEEVGIHAPFEAVP